MNKLTVNKVLLGDDIGGLADQLTADNFNPDSIILIGREGDQFRIRHNCSNNAELLGILITASESMRLNYG